MNETEKVMTEAESLSIISGMINRARNRFSENGTLYLLWGWVIFIECVAQFILIHFFNYQKAYYLWSLSWLAVIYQIFYLAKRKKSRVVKTYTDDLLGFVWLTFVICMLLVVFILQKQLSFASINSIILVLYGMPTFLSGKILKFKPLIIGGFCCWIFAIISPFISYQYQLLLFCAAVLSAWIIPGYLLRAKFKKEN